jgi:hypothetical protein
MPVRYDPLLTRGLADELGERHGGRRVRELRMDRDRRLATLRFRSGPSLLFLLHPEAGHVVESEGSPGETRLNLRGLRLTHVRSPLDERLLRMELPPAGPAGTPHALAVELHTNQWNLLLLRREGGEEGAERDGDAAGEPAWIVRAALWPREPGDRVLRAGAPYRPPRGSRRWREDPPDPAEWRELLEPVEPGARRGTALREIAWLSSVNVEWVLGPCADPEADVGDLEAARQRYLSLRDGPRESWLLDCPWGPQPYVRSLGREEARETPSLRAGMARSLAHLDEWARIAGAAGEGEEEARPPEEPEVGELREAMEAREARLRRRIEALQREREEGPEPEQLREAGHLILARLDRVPRGEERVELEDFSGETREVELDPALSPSENADRLYEEAGKRERALQKIPREIERAEEELERVAAAREDLADVRTMEELEDPEGLWELAGGRPREESGEPEERLPYRKLFTSGGLEVRVGKGAKSNEELTFHHSHTEDVWLHARQVPGAHVILRWGHREGNPPRRDLLEAAVVAAVNSQARHSGTVGVDWTRRKYVRSPRKSPPGAVIPRNVQTVFVEPDESVVKRLERNTARRAG